MSVRVQSHVWDLDLPTTEKMVLLILADHADDEGQNAWPSVARIARKASISERQVQRILRSLCDSGFIAVERQAGGSREQREDRRPNRYTIRMDGVTSVTPRSSSRGDIETPRGDTGVANGVTPMSPEPYIDTSTTEPPTTRTPAQQEAPPPAGPGEAAARAWWIRQDPRPIGKRAWHALKSVCEAAQERGYDQAQIEAALNAIGVVPSVQQMDRALRGVSPQRPSATRMYLEAAASLETRQAQAAAASLKELTA